MAANVLSRLAVVITANTAQMVGQLNTANKKISVISSSLMTLKNTLLGTFGAYQIVNSIQNAVRTLADFDKEMKAVSVIANATGEPLRMLERDALRLGSTTQFTAKQVASLQLEFGRLGFSTREILLSTKATVALATATGEDLARSAEIAGSTLRGFNLDASEMGRVTDVIAVALNESALGLDSFADAIKYVSPVAAAIGVTIEETASMLSVLADAGIKGTQAGTSLRRIFTLLTKDGRPLQEKLAELTETGITLANANDEVGLYAQTALLVLTRYGERIEMLNKLMAEASGQTDKMAKAMEDNLATSLTKVGTAWDALILSFQNSKGILRGTAESLRNLFLVASKDGIGSAILRTGFVPGLFGEGLSDRAKEIEAENKKIDQDQIARQTLINEKAKEYLGYFGKTEKGLENLKNFFSKTAIGADVYAEALRLVKEETEADAKAFVDAQAAKAQAEVEAAKVREALYNRRYINRTETVGPQTSYFEDLATIEKYANIMGMLPSNISIARSETELFAEAQTSLSDRIKESNIDQMIENTDLLTNRTTELRTVIARLSEDFGGLFGDMASGMVTAEQAMARAAAGIINTLKQITLARMIENSAKFGIPGILAAAAGFGLVESLFRRISRGGRSSGGGGGFSTPALSAVGGRDSGFRVEVVGTIRGRDIELGQVENDRVTDRTKANG